MSDKKCDHMGKWKAVGPVSISSQTAMKVGSVLFCSHCGKMKVQFEDAPAPPPPPTPKTPIAVPVGTRPVMPMGGVLPIIKKGLRN